MEVAIKDFITIAIFSLKILNDNGYNINVLTNKFINVGNHVIRVLNTTLAEESWKKLFHMKNILGIINILHIAETSIVILLSNAELECTY